MQLYKEQELKIYNSLTSQKEISDMTESVHYAGTVNVAPKIIEFLALLMNPTGKDIDEDEAKPEGE